jgi:hypothetical protein
MRLLPYGMEVGRHKKENNSSNLGAKLKNNNNIWGGAKVNF